MRRHLASKTAANKPSPDRRAIEIERAMTDDERFSRVVSIAGPNKIMPVRDERFPRDVPACAGYTPGIKRLKVPPLLMADAILGIAGGGSGPGGATALPAALALGASFNPTLAREAGAMVAREARAQGFNVLLGPGINLARDPRNGRNFEYFSEDPLLSGILAAESIRGIQGERVIAALKHFSLNVNETNRHWLNAVIDPAAHRESDLLAFQIAIERAQPGAVMAAYNKINGRYASGNDHLLNDVLKGAWDFKGWVMSDWGGTPAWDHALKGLDQECGVQLDRLMWKAEAFGEQLRNAWRQGKLSEERLAEMVRRALRSTYAVGIDKWGPAPGVDAVKHNRTALEVARQGIVLLKNDRILPVPAKSAARIAVIGGYAHLGVPIGGGSSAVVPRGGYAAVTKIGGQGIMGAWRNLCFLPSSPLAELKKLLTNAQIEFDPGISPAEAALLARRCDVAIVFGIRAEGEGFDSPDLALPWGQDGVIAAVAAVNPNTVVVLETGNPVAMPWIESVKAVVQAWYPGQAGGRVIAEVLVGKVNPAGRLPITFPADLAQIPRPRPSWLGTPGGTSITIRYSEGAEVGYRWYARKNRQPLFAFGHGLSYTTFEYGDLTVSGGNTIRASFRVTNSGKRLGADVPQLYLCGAPGEDRLRLLAFERVQLQPGESRRLTFNADPRLIGRFDAGANRWRIKGGSYQVAVGKSASEFVLSSSVHLSSRLLGR